MSRFMEILKPLHECKTTRESLITKSYGLLKSSIPLIEQMIPKVQVHLRADRLYTLLTQLMEDLIEAHYSPRDQKVERLRQINITLTKLRFYLLGVDMKLYSRDSSFSMRKRLMKSEGAWEMGKNDFG